MSEYVLKVLATELRLVRVKCLSPTCERIVEVPLDRLWVTFHENKCPLCGRLIDLTPHLGKLADHLQNLESSMKALAAAAAGKLLEVSFVLPADPPPRAP